MTTKQALGKVAITPKGAYDGSATYERLDTVTYNGSSYMATQETIGNLPTNTTYWELLASKGDQGIQGIQGPKGDTGNPGASPLVASSTSGMTDTTRIYVNTTDGHWYYYNGSAWTDGGVYQSTGIANNSINYNMFKSDLKENISSYNSEIENYGTNKHRINLTVFSPVHYNIDSSTGEMGTTLINNIYATNDFIEVKPKYYLTLETTLELTISEIYFYEEDKTYIGANGKLLQQYKGQIIIPDNAKYMKFKIGRSASLDVGDLSNVNLYLNKRDNNIIYANDSINIINENEIIEGYFLSTNNDIGASETYNTTPEIPIENATYWTNSRIRMYQLLDVSSQPLGSRVEDVPANSTFTISNVNARFIRFTFYSADSDYLVYKGSQAIDYIPYSQQIKDSYRLSNTMIKEVNKINENGNILNGKKLCTCGDSFTAYTDETFDSGIYEGEYKTWPYLISLRNNMTLSNLAVSGAAISTGDFPSADHFSGGSYTNIPADSDYIILKYGINDNNYSVPIGNIGDLETTTFYGAWNTVLNWIITNRPLAKVGIIVTNGLELNTSQPNNSNYANAIINIAAKYGIPTLNEWNDSNVPLLLRTGRTDVAESIRNKRLATFRISEANTHENAACELYESTFIEDFLRRL